MTVTKKSAAANDVHMRFSEIYAVKGGFTVTSNKVDLSSVTDLREFPVENGSFTYDGGTPSISNFRVYGQSTPWAIQFTPGDGQIQFNVPTFETNIMQMLFGAKGNSLEIDGAGDMTDDETLTAYKGEFLAERQKVVILGLLCISDDHTTALFIKKAKFMAASKNDDDGKPFYVQVTGAVAADTSEDSVALLEASTPTT